MKKTLLIAITMVMTVAFTLVFSNQAMACCCQGCAPDCTCCQPDGECTCKECECKCCK